MGEEDAGAVRTAAALSTRVGEALASGHRVEALALTAEAIAGDGHPVLITVALASRARTLHELGHISEALRVWDMVEGRRTPRVVGDEALVLTVATIGADLLQFGAGNFDAALTVLRSRADTARRVGDGTTADLLAWDAVRRMGYAGRLRDLLDACAALGEPSGAVALELAVPLSVAEALDGRPMAALARVNRMLDRLDRVPVEPPLARSGLLAAGVLAAVWAGEPEQVTLSEPQDDWLHAVYALFDAIVACARHDWQAAEERIQRALRVREEGDVAGITASVLAVAAQVATARGDISAARAYLRQRMSTDERLSSIVRADSEHRVMMTRLALGDDPATIITERRRAVEQDGLALPLLWVEHAAAVYLPGQASTNTPIDRMEQAAPAIAAYRDHIQALGQPQAEPRRRAASRVLAVGGWLPAVASTSIGLLTPRQRQIASLVSEGLTNRDIAVRLQLSLRTVDSHVGSILQRMGAATRAEVSDRVRNLSF